MTGEVGGYANRVGWLKSSRRIAAGRCGLPGEPGGMETEQVRRLVVQDDGSGGAVGVISLGDIALGAPEKVAAEAIQGVSRG